MVAEIALRVGLGQLEGTPEHRAGAFRIACACPLAGRRHAAGIRRLWADRCCRRLGRCYRATAAAGLGLKVEITSAPGISRPSLMARQTGALSGVATQPRPSAPHTFTVS
jgi:hypothetical protein